MNFFRANLLSFLSLFAMIGLSIAVYPALPDSIPTSFDFSGEARDITPKQVMAPMLPAIYLGLIAAINLLIKYSPNRYTMPNSKRAMDIIIFGVGILFCFLHYAILLNDGDPEFFLRYLSYGMAFFMIIVGNVFGKTERNFFLGVKTPWAIASEENWRATHRLAGKMLVSMGILLLLSNTLDPNPYLTILLPVSTALIPVIYSFLYFIKYEKENKAG